MTSQQGDALIQWQYNSDADLVNQTAYMAAQLHSLFLIGLVLIVICIIGFTVRALQSRPRHN